MTKKTSRREKGITLIALIVTIIVLLILAGVTINLAVNNQGIFNKAKTATRAYKNASENEQTGLDEADKEIAKYMPKEGTEGGSGSSSSGTSGSGSSGSSGSGSESGGGTSGSGSSGSGTASSGSITYTDSDGKTQTLKKDTQAGTKIGNTTITNSDNEEIKLDWYLFDVSDDGKTAYLVSTPTYWVPDTTKEVRGAYTPKLVSSYDSNTYAMRQAIQKLANGTNSYSSGSVTYKPSDNTLNYYKSANSLWSAQRGSTAFASMNENEQAACYLADGDIFAGIKSQVNNADGNLKGKIQTLVGGASAEQWCKAYNKQSAAKDHQITCEYRATSVPGYIYKVNGTAQISGWSTHNKTILGNDIYGAAYTNNRFNNSTYPFSSCYWWLASPSASNSIGVCNVNGSHSHLGDYRSDDYDGRFSLLASVAL